MYKSINYVIYRLYYIIELLFSLHTLYILPVTL